MKLFLILAAAFSAGNAGVGQLSDYEEENVLRMWSQYCGRGSERLSIDPITEVFCKTSNVRDQIEEQQVHRIRLNEPESRQNQIIFVQPPSYHYNHRLEIEGDSGGDHKSTIYVLPQRNTHNIQHTYTPGVSGEPSKPTVYFLKGNRDSDVVLNRSGGRQRNGLMTSQNQPTDGFIRSSGDHQSTVIAGSTNVQRNTFPSTGDHETTGGY